MSGTKFYSLVTKREVKLRSLKIDERFSKHAVPKITDADVIALADSIRRGGLRNPIIVEVICGTDGPRYRILDGHHRRAALELLGVEKVKVIAVVKYRAKRFTKEELLS